MPGILTRLMDHRSVQLTMDDMTSFRVLRFLCLSNVSVQHPCWLGQNVQTTAPQQTSQACTSGKNSPSFAAGDCHGTYSLAFYVSRGSLLSAMPYFLQCYSPHTDTRKRTCITSRISQPFWDTSRNGRMVLFTSYVSKAKLEFSDRHTFEPRLQAALAMYAFFQDSRSLPKGLLTPLG